MYKVYVYAEGRHVVDIGQFGNVASARQAMLDHAGTTDLPTEGPFYSPSIHLVEGWFIGRTEYNITTE
jgi:hypothetical protein